MNDTTPLSPDQRAELVAYVDGELDEAATHEMERVLSESAEARHEVDMLGRTFALLDTLPRPGASSEFTAKTLATLKAERAALPWPQQRWYRNVRRGAICAAWLVGLVLSAALGYYAANRLVPDEQRQNRQMIRELPVIEKLDAYSDVRDVEFLRELNEHPVFDVDQADPQN
jgi:anti-sigma factor RsiW